MAGLGTFGIIVVSAAKKQAPAVIAQDGTVIGSPFDSGFCIAALFLLLSRDGLAGNDAASCFAVGGISTRYSADADSVVVNGCDSSRHVGSVVGR